METGSNGPLINRVSGGNPPGNMTGEMISWKVSNETEFSFNREEINKDL